MARDKSIEEANRRIQRATDSFLETHAIKYKKVEKEEDTNTKLSFPKFNSIKELPTKSVPNEPPAHCWTIERVMVEGVWMTPQYPWACADIQAAGSFSAWNAGFGFPPTNQFSMHGPFIVANFCGTGSQNPTGFPLGTTGWWNYLIDPGNAYYRSACSSWFYDEVVAALNGGVLPYTITPNPGEYFTVYENGPTYITADTIDANLPTKPVTAFCLKYDGLEYGYHTDDISTTPDIEGYQHIFCLSDMSHDIEISDIVNPYGPCETEIVTNPRSECADIGSINPRTGGIVFAINQGPNNDMWYEVAPSDVVQVIDHQTGAGTALLPGGTPSSAVGTANCGFPYDEEIKLLNSTSEDQIRYGASYPSQGPSWTNLLMHGNINACGSTVPPIPPGFGCFPLYAQGGSTYPQNDTTYQAIGIGPDSDNPQIDATNYQNHISIGTKAYFFDENGAPCHMYSASSVSNRDTHHPNAFNVVNGVTLIPANTSGANWINLQNGGTTYTSVSNNHDVLVITMVSDPNLNINTFGLLPWCDSNPASGHSVNTGMNSSPTGKTPVWSTKFVNTIYPASSGPFTMTGLEWGVHNRNVVPSPTNGSFGSGKKNTDIIDAYTQYPAPPFGHPVLDTRHIAAEEALIYDTNQIGYPQVLLPEEEGWFLPSLDEFLVMIANVGPNATTTWSNPLNNTQAHIDFQNSFFNHNHPLSNLSSNVYWTSSQDDVGSYLNSTGASTYNGTITDPNDLAVAVELKNGPMGSHHTYPTFTSRCHPLTARPIRRYRCEQEEIREYNFRDTHNIWVENDNIGGQGSGGQQSLTPFVSVFTPGGLASSMGGPNMNDPGVIGAEYFGMGIPTTDVMFNTFGFTGGNFDLTNFQQNNTTPTGRNGTGFTISIWDNQKNFIGTWHYRRCIQINVPNTPSPVRRNAINYKGYLRDCANHPSPIPSGNGQNCNPSPTYTTDPIEFPNLVMVRFEGVTHLAGPHSMFRYGGNREERVRDRWVDQSIPFGDWHHPYMENVFNGWTSSYAYVKIECETIDAIPQIHRYNNMDTGNNTDIDSMEVVCMKNLFEDTYSCNNDQGVLQNWSPPNPNLNPSTGSLLGCGDVSSHLDNQDPFPGGYGWQDVNTTLRGNSEFGDWYGINYVDGREQSPNFTPTGTTAPNLALHPKHWAFIWHAAQKPNSGGINWYQNLHDGYEHCYGYRCHYHIGDRGPAGGIIVGVPDMTGNEIVLGGASTNESDWYYEMSPIDLHDQTWDGGAPTEFGNNGGWFPYANLPQAAEQSFSSVSPWGWYGSAGGNVNQEFIYYDPYTIIGSGIAETTIFPGGNLQVNPPGGPYSVPGAKNAFMLCRDYTSYDQFGNKYCDWYLPNIQESWYIMNNAPAGTFTPNTDTHNYKGDLYWTSNAYRTEPGDTSTTLPHDITAYPGWDQLTRSTMYDTGSGFIKGVPPGGPNPWLTNDSAAYAYNVTKKIKFHDPFSPGPPAPGPPLPPPVTNWQPLSHSTKATYVVEKSSNLKVRAIRRFKCPPPPISGGSPGT